MVGQGARNEREQAVDQLMSHGETKAAFRNWVTASDENRHQFQGEDFLRLDIRHNYLEQRWHDLRFCRDSCIFAVKEQLHKHGAGSVAHMELYLRRGTSAVRAFIRFYPLDFVRSGFRCIVDTP
eukprot:gene91-78_t